MMHPDTEIRFISPEIGHGVVATRFIPRGTITWALDDLDQIFLPERVERMDPLYQRIIEKYAFIDSRGRHVLCWDQARYVNHACEANCLSPGYDFEVAIRDIHPGEELTDDYGGLNIENTFQCRCGSDACRGIIRPDDIVRLADHWDRLIEEPLRLLTQVPQPLWPIVRGKERVLESLTDQAQFPSTRVNYYPGPSPSGR